MSSTGVVSDAPPGCTTIQVMKATAASANAVPNAMNRLEPATWRRGDRITDNWAPSPPGIAAANAVLEGIREKIFGAGAGV
jgi:hypothetical protein